MTLSDEILKLQSNLADSYTACSGKGATIPANQNFDNLPDCIDSIQSSTPAVITSLTVTPSTTQQTITAPSGTDGYNPITVDAVTSSIDSNIVAGNIKDGISILGVTGTYTGGGSFTGIPREVNSSGQYGFPVNNFTFRLPSNATSMKAYSLYYAFYQCDSLTSVDLSSLTTISQLNCFNSTFFQCSNLTSVDLSSLTTITANSCFSKTFSACTSLTSVDLSSLTTISGNNIFYQAFQSCTSLTSLSFDSLNSASFGTSTSQFNNMLSGVTGCTVHFPSNLQSVIGSWSSVAAGFGGTNTTVLFDLPATT